MLLRPFRKKVKSYDNTKELHCLNWAYAARSINSQKTLRGIKAESKGQGISGQEQNRVKFGV